MAPDRTIYFHTMSNPNTNTIMSMLQGAMEQEKITAAGYKIIHVGSDKLPVSILEITLLNGEAWQKKTSFDYLASTMRSHMDNLGIPDLITSVSTEIPMDTTTSFVEANVVKLEILSPIYNVSNLTGVSFLTSRGSQAETPVSIDNKDRTKGLAYIHLSRTMDAYDVDKIILQEPICLSFCLKLPQSSYNTSTGVITTIDNPVNPPPVNTSTPLGTNLSTQLAAAAGTSDVSSTTGTTTPDTTTPITSSMTTKISQLLGLNSGGSSSVISYFRPMSFLDDQKIFWIRLWK